MNNEKANGQWLIALSPLFGSCKVGCGSALSKQTWHCIRLALLFTFHFSLFTLAQPVMGGARWICMPQSGIPVFRTTFVASGRVSKAILRASSLGIYDVFINGRRVGEEELKPDWTDYRKEVAYQEFDVTDLLRKGGNALSAQVTKGWWGGDIAHNAYGPNPTLQFIASLMLTYRNGTRQTIVTDSDWHCSNASPVTNADIYDGESYDARISTDWQLYDFDDSSWMNAKVSNDPHPALIRQTAPPVTIRHKSLWRHPRHVTVYEGSKPAGTTFGTINILSRQDPTGKSHSSSFAPVHLRKGQTIVADLGQNMVGWVQFTAKGKAGTTIRVRHGEMLNSGGDAARLDKGPAGSIWTYNLRTADATLSYTMNGNASGETYHPSTTYMGFRYAELTADADITLYDIVGQVVGSNITEWGEFECSDPDINQLYRNIWWSQRGNFVSLPTDCPQRDERLGWAGDTQIFSRTAMYNGDATEIYRRWMRDLRLSQAESGAVRDIIPYCEFWGEGNAAWGDAVVIVPWNVYDMTGDISILRENYEAMKRWITYCKSQADGTWKYNGAGTAMGDWLSYEPLDSRYVSVCYFAYVSRLMQKVALALSDNESDSYAIDAGDFEQLYLDIRAEWQRRYLTPSGTVIDATQTSYLLALHLGLLPEQYVGTCRQALAQKIISNDYRLSTGFVGTGILCTTLSEAGLDDLAFTLLQQRKNPSWLYSIDQGATTIWERWDSYTIENGFHKHEWNMNSFNHYSYGSVAEWMYAGIAGIQTPDYAVTEIGESGFSHFVLAPHVDQRTTTLLRQVQGKRLTWARARTHVSQGDIEARWDRKDDGRIIYRINIPEGTTATVRMPVIASTDVVLKDGKPVLDGLIDTKAQTVSFQVTSGRHKIECRASSI